MADENPPTPPTPPEAPKLKDLVIQHPELQNEINSMMAENRRNLTKQNQELVTQLEQLKTNTKLTQEERDELQTRITQLEEQYLTKEELTKREQTKLQKDYEGKLTKTTEDMKKWQTMYTSETIDRSLQDAAVEGEALHPTQLVEILRGKTQLAEVDGKYVPVIKFTDTNEEGKQVVLDLSPTETIKRMKELTDSYGNLFKATATSGTGETGGTGSLNKQPALKDLLSSPEKYAEWRKKNPDLDLSKLKR